MHYINFGTSQAAPHVTGTIAILLEKNPRLDAPQIKQILMSTARQDNFTDALPQPLPGPILDPDDRRPEIFWGAGKLDVLGAFNATPPGVLGVDPTDLNFMATLGGPNPPIQRVAVVKAGGGTEVWATSIDAPWIRVSPEAGLAPSVVEVMVDVRNLPAGMHTGHVTFVPAAPGVAGSTLTVTLTLSSP
jgi:subtilisin family serine protease